MGKGRERMNDFWTWLLLTVSVMASLQHSVPTPAQGPGVMLAAVSRDSHRLFGIGSGEKTAKGNVFVEPLARVTPSGEWQALPCVADTGGDQQNACSQFEREYLSKPHTYMAVSADGRGATIQAEPTTLSECFGYTGTGKYSGANIETSAIAASSTDFFSDGPAPQLLPDVTAKSFLKAFADAVPGGLDSDLFLKVFSLRLETQDLVLVQRSYIHRAEPLKFIFAIGAMDHGQFHLLQWKENTGDEDEVVLGTVRLTNGRDFLVTTVADPEGQWFRVYGIRDGKLVVVYSGGGSSC
jgi:hypothetical protein